MLVSPDRCGIAMHSLLPSDDATSGISSMAIGVLRTEKGEELSLMLVCLCNYYRNSGYNVSNSGTQPSIPVRNLLSNRVAHVGHQVVKP